MYNKKKNNGDQGFLGLLMAICFIGLMFKDKVDLFLAQAGIVAGKVFTVSVYVGLTVVVLLFSYKLIRSISKAKKRKQERRIAALEKKLNSELAEMSKCLEQSVAEAFSFGLAEEIAQRHDLKVSLSGPALFSQTNCVFIGNRKVAKIHELEQELYGLTETWDYEKAVVYHISMELKLQNRFNENFIRGNRNLSNTGNFYENRL